MTTHGSPSPSRDDEWRALVALVGDPLRRLADADLATRRAAHDAIDAAISAWSAARSAAEATAALQAVGIPASPAFTNKDLVEDPHLRDRGFVVEWDQPDVGVRRFPGFPVHFERLPVELRPAPSLGQHNEAVLRALGCDERQLAALAAAGTIATTPRV